MRKTSFVLEQSPESTPKRPGFSRSNSSMSTASVRSTSIPPPLPVVEVVDVCLKQERPFVVVASPSVGASRFSRLPGQKAYAHVSPKVVDRNPNFFVEYVEDKTIEQEQPFVVSGSSKPALQKEPKPLPGSKAYSNIKSRLFQNTTSAMISKTEKRTSSNLGHFKVAAQESNPAVESRKQQYATELKARVQSPNRMQSSGIQRSSMNVFDPRLVQAASDSRKRQKAQAIDAEEKQRRELEEARQRQEEHRAKIRIALEQKRQSRFRSMSHINTPRKSSSDFSFVSSVVSGGDDAGASFEERQVSGSEAEQSHLTTFKGNSIVDPWQQVSEHESDIYEASEPDAGSRVANTLNNSLIDKFSAAHMSDPWSANHLSTDAQYEVDSDVDSDHPYESSEDLVLAQTAIAYDSCDSTSDDENAPPVEHDIYGTEGFDLQEELVGETEEHQSCTNSVDYATETSEIDDPISRDSEAILVPDYGLSINSVDNIVLSSMVPILSGTDSSRRIDHFAKFNDGSEVVALESVVNPGFIAQSVVTIDCIELAVEVSESFVDDSEFVASNEGDKNSTSELIQAEEMTHGGHSQCEDIPFVPAQDNFVDVCTDIVPELGSLIQVAPPKGELDIEKGTTIDDQPLVATISVTRLVTKLNDMGTEDEIKAADEMTKMTPSIEYSRENQSNLDNNPITMNGENEETFHVEVPSEVENVNEDEDEDAHKENEDEDAHKKDEDEFPGSADTVSACAENQTFSVGIASNNSFAEEFNLVEVNINSDLEFVNSREFGENDLIVIENAAIIAESNVDSTVLENCPLVNEDAINGSCNEDVKSEVGVEEHEGNVIMCDSQVQLMATVSEEQKSHGTGIGEDGNELAKSKSVLNEDKIFVMNSIVSESNSDESETVKEFHNQAIPISSPSDAMEVKLRSQIPSPRRMKILESSQDSPNAQADQNLLNALTQVDNLILMLSPDKHSSLPQLQSSLNPPISSIGYKEQDFDQQIRFRDKPIRSPDPKVLKPSSNLSGITPTSPNPQVLVLNEMPIESRSPESKVSNPSSEVSCIEPNSSDLQVLVSNEMPIESRSPESKVSNPSSIKISSVKPREIDPNIPRKRLSVQQSCVETFVASGCVMEPVVQSELIVDAQAFSMTIETVQVVAVEADRNKSNFVVPRRESSPDPVVDFFTSFLANPATQSTYRTGINSRTQQSSTPASKSIEQSPKSPMLAAYDVGNPDVQEQIIASSNIPASNSFADSSALFRDVDSESEDEKLDLESSLVVTSRSQLPAPRSALTPNGVNPAVYTPSRGVSSTPSRIRSDVGSPYTPNTKFFHARLI